jgi:hypothetical protein
VGDTLGEADLREALQRGGRIEAVVVIARRDPDGGVDHVPYLLPSWRRGYIETCARMRRMARMLQRHGLLQALSSMMRADFALHRSAGRDAGRFLLHQAAKACRRVAVRRRL